MSTDTSPEQYFDDDPTFQIARLGIECTAFLDSTVGRYLLRKAEVEIEDLRDDLETFEDLDKSIRLEIKARRLMVDYLKMAIQDGRSAEEIIHSEEASED